MLKLINNLHLFIITSLVLYLAYLNQRSSSYLCFALWSLWLYLRRVLPLMKQNFGLYTTLTKVSVWFLV